MVKSAFIGLFAILLATTIPEKSDAAVVSAGQGIDIDFDVSAFSSSHDLHHISLAWWPNPGASFDFSLRLGSTLGGEDLMSTVFGTRSAGATFMDGFLAAAIDLSAVSTVYARFTQLTGTGDYRFARLDMFDDNQNLARIQKTFLQENVHVSAVPVPAGLPLLLTTFAGLALIRRRS